jgi:hypothetical protein
MFYDVTHQSPHVGVMLLLFVKQFNVSWQLNATRWSECVYIHYILTAAGGGMGVVEQEGSFPFNFSSLTILLSVFPFASLCP